MNTRSNVDVVIVVDVSKLHKINVLFYCSIGQAVCVYTGRRISVDVPTNRQALRSVYYPCILVV